jgi:hypothetical protein
VLPGLGLGMPSMLLGLELDLGMGGNSELLGGAGEVETGAVSLLLGLDLVGASLLLGLELDLEDGRLAGTELVRGTGEGRGRFKLGDAAAGFGELREALGGSIE